MDRCGFSAGAHDGEDVRCGHNCSVWGGSSAYFIQQRGLVFELSRLRRVA